MATNPTAGRERPRTVVAAAVPLGVPAPGLAVTGVILVVARLVAKDRVVFMGQRVHGHPGIRGLIAVAAAGLVAVVIVELTHLRPWARIVAIFLEALAIIGAATRVTHGAGNAFGLAVA